MVQNGLTLTGATLVDDLDDRGFRLHGDADRRVADYRKLIDSDVPLTVERRLTRGDRVRVKSGALRGIEGEILRRENGTRLLVAVNYMEQGVSIEIDDFTVELVRSNNPPRTAACRKS